MSEPVGLITPQMMLLQRELHANYDYGRGVDAYECAAVVRALAEPGASVLDYGCGQGHLKGLLSDFSVREYDPCIDGKDGEPEPADYIVCADVLEHIEPELLRNVIAHIRGLVQKRAIFVIATRPSRKTMADGRNAHTIVQNADWWRGELGPLFRLERFEDRSEEGRGILAVAEPTMILGDLKAIGAVSDDDRLKNTGANIGHTWKRIPDQPVPPHDRILIVCGYGPSINDTWKCLAKQKRELKAEIISVSGAHDYLWKKGIRPDWHVECDPRPHKSDMMRRPLRGTKYMMASCCHPDFIKRLAEYDLTLWHLFNGDDSFKIRQFPSEKMAALIPGGGSVMLRTFTLYYFLGYRNFIVHGFDCSFSDKGEHHAGAHTGKQLKEMKIRVASSDKWFVTAPVMVTYARHMIKDIGEGRFPGCQFAFMGDGLFQTMLRHAQMTPTAGADYFSMAQPDIDQFGRTVAA